MPNLRRWYLPQGSYFFTLVTANRIPILCDAVARSILKAKLEECLKAWPFSLDAIVLLPDHLHSIWTMPPNDSSYSKRWGWVKKEFTKDWLEFGGGEARISSGRQRERRRGVWQPRFWEHCIYDENDYERHLDYIHYNPVKHGLVECPGDWKWSTFQKWVKLGQYSKDWGSIPESKFDFIDIHDTVGE